MKSPQLITFVIAIVFAVLAFFISGAVTLTPVVAAILVFVASFVSPLIGAAKSGATEESVDTVDVTTLYVGNLPYRANETAVRELFSEYGQVQSVRLMKDKHTGKRRGFGFVEISAKDAESAIASLNDTEFQQRTLKVREAKERPEASA